MLAARYTGESAQRERSQHARRSGSGSSFVLVSGHNNGQERRCKKVLLQRRAGVSVKEDDSVGYIIALDRDTCASII